MCQPATALPCAICCFRPRPRAPARGIRTLPPCLRQDGTVADCRPVPVVRTTDDDGVGQIVDRLVALGHSAITYVDGGKGVIATDWCRGCRTAMRRHGLDAHISVLRGDNTEAAGERAARHLLDSGELPTVVVAFNNQSAIGVLAAVARAGVSVPGEVSVAGYDDDRLSRLRCFDLTTSAKEPRNRRATRWPPPWNAWTRAVPSPERWCWLRIWCYAAPWPSRAAGARRILVWDRTSRARQLEGDIARPGRP